MGGGKPASQPIPTQIAYGELRKSRSVEIRSAGIWEEFDVPRADQLGMTKEKFGKQDHDLQPLKWAKF